MADVMASTTSTVVSNSTNGESGDGVNTIIFAITIPLMLLLVVGVIILVVIILISVRQRHKKNSKYRPLPTSSKDEDVVKLPYPPRVKYPGSTFPNIKYSLATQLPQPPETASSRYPFIQHRVALPQGSIQEKRPPRLRTKRRGNHKHGKGKHVVVQPINRIESEHSPTPESDQSIGDGIFLHPAHKYPAKEDSTVPVNPEVSLVLQHDETTAVLVIRVEHVLNLPLREDGQEVDAYVRLHFSPVHPAGQERRSSKTQTQRQKSSPVFQEEISYPNMPLTDLMSSTLHINVLDYRSYGKHLVLGQNELPLNGLEFVNGEAQLALILHPPKIITEQNGVVFLSLCFDPDNKKLSIIILRAKDLNNNKTDETDPVAKITISMKERLIAKLKTKKKLCSCSPIFNEAVSCTVNINNIRDVQVTVVMINDKRQGLLREIGTVILGSNASGDGLRHWNDALASPGKHIAEWHYLRRLD